MSDDLDDALDRIDLVRWGCGCMTLGIMFGVAAALLLLAYR